MLKAEGVGNGARLTIPADINVISFLVKFQVPGFFFANSLVLNTFNDKIQLLRVPTFHSALPSARTQPKGKVANIPSAASRYHRIKSISKVRMCASVSICIWVRVQAFGRRFHEN